MIGFFPIPFPDEILYSVFARYHARSRNKSLAATTKDLFGHEASRIVVDLPNKLGYLVKQLPPGSLFTVERLTNDHTLFPFYCPFLPSVRIEQLRQDMIEKSPGGAIHGRLGILTSKIDVEYLRFCPTCADQDAELYGEPYWHRVHQLPGIFVCPNHSVFLENSHVKSSYHNRKETLVLARKEIKKTLTRYLDLNNKHHIALLDMAKQGLWLLQQTDLTNLGPDFFRKRFLQILFRKNLATANATAYVTRVETEFKKFYSSDFLSLMSSNLEGKFTWVRRLLQSSKHFQHPVRNLLFLHFLETSVEELIKLPERTFPSGGPPYPCLNSASKHYKELRVKKFTTARMQHRESGVSVTFECDCGFVYRRFDYDEKGERIYEYDSVISYGDIFIKKLLKLKDKGLSLSQIARELKVSIDIVVCRLRKTSQKNKPLTQGEVFSSEFPSDSTNQKRDLYRSEWKQMCRLNPKLSRTELRKLNPQVGNWLYTKDMRWLNANSPARRVTKKKAFRVDWKKKDEEFSLKAEKLALELSNSTDKPVRISKTGLARKLNCAYIINKRPECLPKTIETLKKYEESTEDFIVRRLRFTANCFIEEMKLATYWELITRASVMKPHLVELPKVQATIQESLQKIKNAYDSGWAD